MKSLFAMLILLVCAPSAWADRTSLMTNIQGRRTISLNGRWQVIIDPYPDGFPLTSSGAASDSGLLQPQGPDL